MTSEQYPQPTPAPTAKAPLTAYQAALRARMITVACTLAHQRAIKATKEAGFYLGTLGLLLSQLSQFDFRQVALNGVPNEHFADLVGS